MKRLKIITIILLVSLTLIYATSCKDNNQSSQPLTNITSTNTTQVTSIENGLSADERKKFYHMSEGSEFFPFSWAQCLEDSKTHKDFLSPENLQRFGLIPDPDDADGLPVGIAKAKRKGLKLGKEGPEMIGVNCTACHVGQISYNGKNFRIDGAPNMFDVFGFFQALSYSTKSTAENPEKLVKFLVKLAKHKNNNYDEAEIIPPAEQPVFNETDANIPSVQLDKETKQALIKLDENGKATLTSKLEKIFKETESTVEKDFSKLDKDIIKDSTYLKNQIGVFESYIRLLDSLSKLPPDPKYPNYKYTEPGFARADAFGTAANVLFGARTVNMTAPASFPEIWELDKTEWYHWISNTHSVIERNIGQVLGLGASFDPKTLNSTIKLDNLYQLETLGNKTKPPKWEDIFGKVDSAKAEEGKKIYIDNCAKCHDKVQVDEKSGHKTYNLYSPEEVGTDPNEAINFGIDIPTASLPKEILDAIKPPAISHSAKLQDQILPLIKQKYYTDHNISETTQKQWEDGRIPNSPFWRDAYKENDKKVYPAKPLKGVWATAPYLHNGSVPTLRALLLPAEQRPKTFYLGKKDYNAKDLGYKVTIDPTAPTDTYPYSPDYLLFFFDTAKAGNSNKGHEFGTNLSEEQKDQLLEYLKIY